MEDNKSKIEFLLSRVSASDFDSVRGVLNQLFSFLDNTYRSVNYSNKHVEKVFNKYITGQGVRYSIPDDFEEAKMLCFALYKMTAENPECLYSLFHENNFNNALQRMHDQCFDYFLQAIQDITQETNPISQINGENMISIFVSHAKTDENLVSNLIKMLKDSIDINHKEIRCSSVPGYKFTGSTHVSTAIRTELIESKIVLGIISENSVKSNYVLFELGAGWCLEKATALIDKKTDYSDIPGPLSENHALKLSEKSDLYSLIDLTSEKTGKSKNDINLINDAVDTFLNSI